MRISDLRYDRDKLRYDLAWRMIKHEVRTTTISVWTGLSKYRIQTLFREYMGPTTFKRHRGVPPSQPAYFVRSLQHECESAAFACIAMQMSIFPTERVPDASKSLPGLARGERLLDGFDLYRALVPRSLISLEHAVLLLTELAQRRTLSLQRCEKCLGLMVIDRFAVRHTQCGFCRSDGRSVTSVRAAARRKMRKEESDDIAQHRLGNQRR